MRIRLIALDVDGTLLNSRQEVSPDTVAALDRAYAKGIHIVLSTGRILAECRHFLKKLPMIRYANTCTGAQVLDLQTEQTLVSFTIPAVEIQRLFEKLRDLDAQINFFDPRDNHPHTAQWMMDTGERYSGDRAPVLRTYYHCEQDLEKYVSQIDCPMIKIHVFFANLQHKQEALKRLAGEPYNIVESMVNDLEINPIGASKELGLAKLTERLRVRKEETMAIGDGDNDVTMLQYVGLPVCMANGSEKAKACAKYITDDNDHDGVAKAINMVLEGKL